jgi:hypothetical protein
MVHGIPVMIMQSNQEGMRVYLYLAQTAGRVVLPTVIAVKDTEDADSVAFVDASGAIVAIFSRADVATYSEREIDAPEEQQT